jgi:hypothetical protein
MCPAKEAAKKIQRLSVYISNSLLQINFYLKQSYVSSKRGGKENTKVSIALNFLSEFYKDCMFFPSLRPVDLSLYLNNYLSVKPFCLNAIAFQLIKTANKNYDVFNGLSVLLPQQNLFCRL